MNAQLTAAIARLKEKGDELGEALAYEQGLEDQRSLLKELAIQRIIERDKCSPTTAKDIVRSDLEYMNHRNAQRAATVAHYRADAEYEAAKAEATQASLITPDALLLMASNDALLGQRDHWKHVANDEHAAVVSLGTEVADLQNQLRDEKQANSDLVQANRDLAGQLATANEMLGKVRHELTTIHGLQATDKPDTFLEAPKGAARAVAETSWTLDVKSLIMEIDALLGVPVGGA